MISCDTPLAPKMSISFDHTHPQVMIYADNMNIDYERPYCVGHQNEGFSKQTLKGATAASLCRILDRDTALESPNAEL